MAGFLDVDKARRELEGKDLLTIERETALTWGGRAAASYAIALEDDDHAERMRAFWEGETYRAEAVEHAAMTEDAGFVRELTAEVEAYRSKAREHLLAAGHAFVEGNRTPRQQRPEQPSRAQRLASRPGASQQAAAPAAAQAPAAAPPASQPAPPTSIPPRPRPPNRVAQTTPGLGRRPGDRPPAQ